MKTSNLLNERAAATYLNVSIRTLQHWRYIGEGPSFIRLNNKRLIRYRLADLDEYVESGRVGSKPAIVAPRADFQN